MASFLAYLLLYGGTVNQFAGPWCQILGICDLALVVRVAKPLEILLAA